MEHTQGEWTVKHETMVMCGNRSIASCGGYQDISRHEEVRQENIANTNLIAAAPDLLQSCKDLLARLDAVDPEHRDSPMRKFARAAVAKAK